MLPSTSPNLSCGWLSRCIASLVVLSAVGSLPPAFGQNVSNLSIRPFVTAFVPVVGRNGVGGVEIDAAGVVKHAAPRTIERLKEVRTAATERTDAKVNAASPLRKISLRRLQATIERHRRTREPLPAEVRFLAGLQRVRYILVYPEDQDIVLAGPAEGWRLAEDGSRVGVTSRQPVIELDDLLVALRTADAAAQGAGLSCSIDPTADGLQRLQKLLRKRGLRPTPTSITQMEKRLGPQQITITGMEPDSHFARTMLAADYQMKRFAMGLEPSPVEQMPSYLELLRRQGRVPRNATPRWWMATNYEPLLRDSEGLAWQLQGPGVQVLTEHGYLTHHGEVVREGTANPTAQQWAKTMTERFEPLSKARPVFAQLRNCMDLAVTAALIRHHRLTQRAGCELSLLLDDRQLQTVSYQVPRTVASQASLVQTGRRWIVSVSGGVDIDSWAVLQNEQPSQELPKVHAAGRRATTGDRFWWD